MHVFVQMCVIFVCECGHVCAHICVLAGVHVSVGYVWVFAAMCTTCMWIHVCVAHVCVDVHKLNQIKGATFIRVY